MVCHWEAGDILKSLGALEVSVYDTITDGEESELDEEKLEDGGENIYLPDATEVGCLAILDGTPGGAAPFRHQPV
jgi:hypothetical protein